MQVQDIIIIGGGLAGLIAANLLGKAGKQVLVIEKKAYPFHRVCGEYISNEVRGFLMKEELFPSDLDIGDIHTFQLTSTKGKSVSMPLDLGGFGVSRYALDNFFYHKAKKNGAEFLLQHQVEEVFFDVEEKKFILTLGDGSQLCCNHLIGAYGKRSKVDKFLGRGFMSQRSPYIGVKYHIQIDYDPNTVALHNFEGGYCGINRVEDGIFNLCYLGSREQLRAAGTIEQMEADFLWKNPFLKSIWKNSEFLFERPEVINEINFSPKQPVENHILMAGDAAGLITPLCGNGMAIAIHTGKLAAEALIKFTERNEIERFYTSKWNAHFRQRLWVGRNVQKLFGAKGVSEFSVSLIKRSPFIANQIMKRTHGEAV